MKSKQRTICYLKIETGELVTCELQHKDKEQVRAFYKQFPGPVVIGLKVAEMEMFGRGMGEPEELK